MKETHQTAGPAGTDNLSAAGAALYAHNQATGHDGRIVLSPKVENRSGSTKWLSHGGRGRIQAECRQCSGPAAVLS